MLAGGVMKKLILAIAVLGVTGCTAVSSPQQTAPASPAIRAAHIPDQRPDVAPLPLSGQLDHGYVITGDPVVAPIQAFSDNAHLYLQLRSDQIPPIATTRDGALLEYDVRRSLVILPKADYVDLRLGPRRASVQRKGLSIVALAREEVKPLNARIDLSVTPPKTAADAAVRTADFAKPASGHRYEVPFDYREKGLSNVIGGTIPRNSSWRICAHADSHSYTAAIGLQAYLRSIGATARVDAYCSAPENVLIMEEAK
jgi:hypothetical protein